MENIQQSEANILLPEEIKCLQKLEMLPSEIAKTTLQDFNRLYDQHEFFEEYLQKYERIFIKQEELGIITITIQDEDYPEALLDIKEDAPPMTHCMGDISLLHETNCIAVIGVRKASRQGTEKAYSIATKFTKEGSVIVSGLALGCDTAAHRACVDAGGKTIAIVANGLDTTHPIENVELQKAILQSGGLLLSENEIGVKASVQGLKARNRLQAAFSKAVILAQAPEKSGSMLTMKMARKYKKSCYAAEFPRYDEYSSGNQFLLENRLASPI
jgi:DNA processing protein